MSKKPKKLSRKKLVKRLDDAFSLWIRARDKREFGEMCSLCPNGKAELAAHLISSVKYSVRWDPANVYAQCRGCNFRHEYYPQYYTAWWIKRHGEKAYLDLVEKSNVPAKFKREQLETMLAVYES